MKCCYSVRIKLNEVVLRMVICILDMKGKKGLTSRDSYVRATHGVAVHHRAWSSSIEVHRLSIIRSVHIDWCGKSVLRLRDKDLTEK